MRASEKDRTKPPVRAIGYESATSAEREPDHMSGSIELTTSVSTRLTRRTAVLWFTKRCYYPARNDDVLFRQRENSPEDPNRDQLLCGDCRKSINSIGLTCGPSTIIWCIRDRATSTERPTLATASPTGSGPLCADRAKSAERINERAIERECANPIEWVTENDRATPSKRAI